MPAASIGEHLVDQIPAVLWLAFAIAVVFWLRHEIRERASSLTGLTLPGGVALQFAEKIGEASIDRGEDLAGGEQARLARRAERNAAAIRDLRVLWIDDDVESTANERAALGKLGVEIVAVSSSAAALEQLRRETFDLVLSDIAREQPQAGIRFAAELRANGNAVPFIFYTGAVDPERGVPAPASGIADRPAELVHLVFDQAERLRG